MAKPSYGIKVQNRSRLLLQSILAFANDACDKVEHLHPHIRVSWQLNNQLVVRTEIRYLEELVKLLHPDESLNSEHIKESLKRFQEPLGILKDNRIATQGTSIWHFTLTLWYPRFEEEKNLQAFDRTWNEGRSNQLKASTELMPPTLAEAKPGVNPSIRSWGDAVDTASFYGREQELALLQQWILQDRCRLVMLLGMGGMGKTVLSVRLAQQLEASFEGIIWRSLRNALPLSTLLTDILLTISGNRQLDLSDTIDGQINQLLDFLRSRRYLLVLDNFESLLKTEAESGQYRDGYGSYGQLLRCVGETAHQSCLILTSREKPGSLGAREGENLPIRSLRLTGVDEATARAILQDKGVTVLSEDWLRLMQHYGGNPLALKIAITTVYDLFDGDIASFSREGDVVFGDIADLIHQQVSRLTPLEIQVMQWLAIARDPLTLNDLKQRLIPPPAQKNLLAALSSLQRRSLLEKQDSAFTQQPVVMEYMTEQILEQICDAIVETRVDGLETITLTEATAKDYIRQAQERTILSPIVERLTHQLGSIERLKENSQSLLTILKQRPLNHASYAAGNLLNLLHKAQVDLRGWDFSNLALWQVYLPGMRLPQVNFGGTDLTRSIFTETVGGILDAAYAPDGQSLATAISQDIVIWDIPQQQQRLSCQGHTAWVVCLAYHPLQPILASGSIDTTLRLWDGQTGQCIRTFRGHQSAIQAIAFSPDGQLLASGSNEGEICLWHVESGTCLHRIQAHSNRILSVQFCPQQPMFASSGQDGTVKLWDTPTATCQRVLPIAVNWSLAIDISPDGQTLVTGCDGTAVKYWDLTTGDCIQTLADYAAHVWSVRFRGDGQQIVTASDDKTIRCWDVATGTCMQTMVAHAERAWLGAYSPDQRHLVSVGDDQTAKIWDSQTGNCIQTIQAYSNWVQSVAFHPNRQWVASSSEDRQIRLWDVETGRCLRILSGHTNLIASVTFSPDGVWLASASDDQTIRLWDVMSGDCVRILRGHEGWVPSVMFSSDGRYLISGSYDHTVCLWDCRSGEKLMTLKGHDHRVKAVAIAPSDTYIASTSDDRTVKLWDRETGACLHTLEDHTDWVTGVAFHPHHSVLVSGSCDRNLRLWDIHTGECLRMLQGHTERIRAVTFSPTGDVLASCGDDNTVRLWDWATGQCLRVLQGHTRSVWAIAFSADSQWLVSCSEDETLRLWNWQTGSCSAVLRPERPYEGMNITGIIGLTPIQKKILHSLGAIEDIPLTESNQ